jgi:hypothetical protein
VKKEGSPYRKPNDLGEEFLVRILANFPMPSVMIGLAEVVQPMMIEHLSALVSHDGSPNAPIASQANFAELLMYKLLGSFTSTRLRHEPSHVIFADMQMAGAQTQVVLYTRCVATSSDNPIEGVDPFRLHADGDFLFGRGAGGHNGLLAMTLGAVHVLVFKELSPCNVTLVIDSSSEPATKRLGELEGHLRVTSPNVVTLILHELFDYERQTQSPTGVLDVLPMLEPVPAEMLSAAAPAKNSASGLFGPSYREVMTPINSKRDVRLDLCPPVPALTDGAAAHLRDRTSRLGLALGAATIMRTIARAGLTVQPTSR